MTLGDSAPVEFHSPKHVLTMYTNVAVNWELTLKEVWSCLVLEFR